MDVAGILGSGQCGINVGSIAKVGVAVGVVGALEMGGFAAWASVSLRGTFHKPVRVHLWPQMIVRP